MGVERKEVPVLRLQDVSPRRMRAFSLSFKCEKGDPLGTGATPPFLSAPSSPKFLRLLEDRDSAVTENLLPSCRLEGAVPFKWEEKPGTPKSPHTTLLCPWTSALDLDHDSPRSATKEPGNAGSLSPFPEDPVVETEEVLQPDFEFTSSRFDTELARRGGVSGETTPPVVVAADDLFSQGRLIPLKPPPRLQSQLVASNRWRSSTSESLAVTAEGGQDGGSPQSSFAAELPETTSTAPPLRSLGQTVGLTTVGSRGVRSGTASAAQKLLAFCGLSTKGVRRNLAQGREAGREEARLSSSDVYLMSGQDSGGSTDARLSSAKESSGELYGSYCEERPKRSRGRSVDFSGYSGSKEGNFASADCNLSAGGVKAALPTAPVHRKGKSLSKEKSNGNGFFSGFRSVKDDETSRQAKEQDNIAAHRRVRSLSPLSVFKRAEGTRRVSVDDKDMITFDSQTGWPSDDKERDVDARPIAAVPKKPLSNTSKAWNGLKGLTLNELLEAPRDAVAASRQTDSPGSNCSSGSFGTGSGSFGSMSSSNSGSNSCGVPESADSGPLPYYPQDLKPGRYSNASASPGLKKALLAKSQGSPPDSACTSDALISDPHPLYRRYKTPPGKEDPLGKFKSLLPNKSGIFSCLGCSTVKGYDAFPMRVVSTPSH